MILNPQEAYIMGGTWRIPVLSGLYDKNMIDSIKRDETYTDTAFNTEYESIWSGVADDAFFDPDTFDRHRVL